MAAYYNENDPYAAQWLRNLVQAGHIAAGDVDERSIKDVKADDLRGYQQAHFFAGIGGWPYALRLAGWSDAKPVWTGSCPCQPLSSAGQHKGHADERHLWPAFHSLIAECRPTIIFGEQVASKDGREWFAAVRADLEIMGYACGGADLCAAGVGAPHIRQRIFWVAEANRAGQDERPSSRQQPICDEGGHAGKTAFSDAAGDRRQTKRQRASPGHVDGIRELRGREACWDAESMPEPLADGISARMDKLRAFGNAIVPQVAAEFIAATILV